MARRHPERLEGRAIIPRHVSVFQSHGLRIALLAAVLVCGVSLSVHAQWNPSESLVFGDGRLTLGGDVSATFSCAGTGAEDDGACGDDLGFFNYTDYEHSAVRMLRIDVSADLRAGRHVSLLGEMRTENGSRPVPYALYLRIRPWPTRAFDIQAGRVPPTFGAFARRSYATDNLLIGYPLAYQYLTSLRADALPADVEDLLRMRGRGWLSTFPVGNRDAKAGLPLVSAFRWDTGAQVHAARGRLDLAGGITTGTLANPLVGDDNSGRQFSGRASFRVTPGLLLGASAARGPFVTRTAAEAAGAARADRLTQTAWGADVEYSRDHYLVRVEAITSRWRLPEIGPAAIRSPLRATSASVEGRYKLQPGLYVAARLDHLTFSTLTSGTLRTQWEAPVTRVEVGGGYSLHRNLLLKLSVQHNTRPAGRVQQVTLGATQLVFWF